MTPMQALIVDDNETMREAMAQILARLPISVVQAADGESALAALSERSFDLVVTDYRMPGMNGLQVLKEIKNINPEIDVVIITAYGTIETAVEALKVGARDYITKPADLDELIILANRIAERRQLKRRMFCSGTSSGIATTTGI